MEALVAGTLFDGVHVPLFTAPQVALPVLCDRSVAQLIVAALSTTSLAYGYRVSADEAPRAVAG
jgi:hypothetical protein